MLFSFSVCLEFRRPTGVFRTIFAYHVCLECRLWTDKQKALTVTSIKGRIYWIFCPLPGFWQTFSGSFVIENWDKDKIPLLLYFHKLTSPGSPKKLTFYFKIYIKNCFRFFFWNIYQGAGRGNLVSFIRAFWVPGRNSPWGNYQEENFSMEIFSMWETLYRGGDIQVNFHIDLKND